MQCWYIKKIDYSLIQGGGTWTQSQINGVPGPGFANSLKLKIVLINESSLAAKY